ncbi:MAG: DUF4832 domain-containing protein [Planctomycetes bacterium]|nr:DUF4832 domain-containing protein [Planctomycetota bacterium]
MTEVIRRIRPTEIHGYLANPHRGCCTFQRFNGDALFPGTSWSEEGPLTFPAAAVAVAEDYLPTTVAYCRWFWAAMEPERGVFDFSMIDRSLEVCRARGQTLAVRLMAFGSVKQPAVPEWFSRTCPMEQLDRHGTPFRQPVHDSPEYLQHWGGFIREFARRYDGNPLIESIDLAYVGPWGEGDGICSPAQCARFSAVWREAFTSTPRMAQLVEGQIEHDVHSGAGWRHDCFGDLSSGGSPEVLRSESFNSTFLDFPRLVQGAVKEAWKAAPIHFETCWVPMHWYRNDYDLDFILAQGLKLHGSYFMPKSTALPRPWMDRLSAFCNRLGYRFVLRQAIHPLLVARNSALSVACWIENIGVAPIYRRYDLALRLRQHDREEVIPLPDVDIRTWLPGDAWVERSVTLPAAFVAGHVRLAIGLVVPGTRDARVAFAVKEVYSDRWVDLGGFDVT